MISLASVQTTNNINFKAVPEYSKKITGEMKYALSNQVGAIKSAIIDILRRAKNNTLNEKAKAILERYNITVTDTVKIASLLGIGSLATFFIKKENDGTENLGLKIEQPDKRTDTYIFDKNKVLKINTKNSRYLTSQEINNCEFQNLITEVLEKADLPLLEIRQAYLPKIQPYVPKHKHPVKTKAEIQTETKVEKIKAPTVEELNLKLEEQNIRRVGKAPKQFKNATEAYHYIQELDAEGRRDTSVEIDLMLGKFPGEIEDITPKTKLPKITAEATSIKADATPETKILQDIEPEIESLPKTKPEVENLSEIKPVTEAPTEVIFTTEPIKTQKEKPSIDVYDKFIEMLTRPRPEVQEYKKPGLLTRIKNIITDFFKV